MDPCKSGPKQGTHLGALFAYVPCGTDQDGILLHPEAPRWAVANQSSLKIVECLAAPGGSTDSAADFLVEEYGLTLAAARQDVDHVMDHLARHGLSSDSLMEEPRPRIGSLMLVLTERCNLACTHCYGAFPACKELPLPRVLRLIDELVEGGGRTLTLSGGEPLLYRGLKDVVARVGKRIRVQFCTNGTLIDAQWARLFSQQLDPYFQISLDGPTAATHDAIRGPRAFEGALRGIRQLQEAGLGDRIILATTIQRTNKNVLLEILHLAAKLGVKTLRFLPLRKEGRAQETWACTGESLDVPAYEAIFDRFLTNHTDLPKGVELSCGLNGFTLNQSPEGNGGDLVCSVGSTMFVEASGEAFPCAVLNRKECLLGSVLESSLHDLVHGEAMAKLHAIKTRRKLEIPRCAPCLWKNFCQAGCMAMAVNETGTFWDVDEFCSYRQRAYPRAFNDILAISAPPSDPTS